MKRKKVYIFLFALLMFFSGSFFVIKNTDAVTVSANQEKIIRDTQRLSDLAKLKTAIEAYKTRVGYYPKLDTGTYVRGYVNSTWDSWQNFCSLIGLSNCPFDPINLNINCDCTAFGGSCDINELNTRTCYSAKLSKTTCYLGSNLYQYKSLNNGRNYSLKMDLEYRSNDASYFKINSTTGGNLISVDSGCAGVSTSYGDVLSNKTPVCGNNVIEYGEVCDGNKKLEMCTNKDGKVGKLLVGCTSKCVYEAVKTTGVLDSETPKCNVDSFCGDLILNGTEECDGGNKEMCFDYGKHDWYKKQIKYCNKSCKYENNITINSSNFKDLCIGYCGDGTVNSVNGEECDLGIEYMKWDISNSKFKSCAEYSSSTTCTTASGCTWNGKCLPKDNCSSYPVTTCPTSDCIIKNDLCIAKNADILKREHCGIVGGLSCKSKNNPVAFPEIIGVTNEGNFTVKSYGRKTDGTYSYINLEEHVQTGNKISIASDLLFLEVKVKIGKDVDGDNVQYKLDFAKKDNRNIGFFKTGSNSISYGSRPDVISEGVWMDETSLNVSSDGFITFRIYSTLKDTKDEDKIKLIDGEYYGNYEFTISMKDPLGAAVSKNFNFYVKSICGDSVLQVVNDNGQKEYCEYKTTGARFFNFRIGEPSVTATPTGGALQECVVINNDGKWSDEDCSDLKYGICKRDLIVAGGNCEANGFTAPTGYNFCYAITKVKKNWDGANTICEGYGYGSKLFVVKNAVENKFIMGKIPSGETSLWLGYYNINTIRSTSDKLAYESYNGIPVNKESLITSVDEDGNRNINNDKIINGGGGYRGDNQYMCSNTCADVGGYCGDGVVENGKQKLNFYDSFWGNDSSGNVSYYVHNFEECDSSSFGRIQEGIGSSKTDQYGCVDCKKNGGFCGDKQINSTPTVSDTDYNKNKDNISTDTHVDFEHCDPTYMLSPEESRKRTEGRGYGANYVCWTGANIPAINSLITAPWAPYEKISGIDTKITTYSDYLAKKGEKVSKFEVNDGGICQVSSGGYCGDGKIQLSYNQMSKGVREGNNYINPVYNSVNVYSNGGTYGKNSFAFTYGYGTDESNNLKVAMRIEECDPGLFVTPAESNDLIKDSFYKKVRIDVDNSIVIGENFFNGIPRLKYVCDKNCSFGTYGFNGEKLAFDLYTGSLGYCGDGIISTYGYGGDVINGSVVNDEKYVNTANKEECDPKNHIVAANGYGYGQKNNIYFGCYPPGTTDPIYAKYIYGKGCSSFVTPATSSNTLTYKCGYDCKNTVVGANVEGYCGDGKLQSDFFEECDYADTATKYKALPGVSVINDKASTKSIYNNYLCGSKTYGYFFDPAFIIGYGNTIIGNDSNEFSPLNTGVTKNRNLACRQFGGYLGDGKVQSCVIAGNGYGIENWELCNRLTPSSTIKYTTKTTYAFPAGITPYFTLNSNVSGISFYASKTDPGVDYLEFCDPKDSTGYDSEFGYGCNSTGTGCNPGFYINNGVCKVCEAGKFCVGSGYGWGLCPAGSYQGGRGKSTCELCTLGKYQITPGSTTCSAECVMHYRDADGDSWGQGLEGTGQYCDPKIGTYNTNYEIATKFGDCNDDPSSGKFINPGAEEKCDQIDSNCNNLYNENCVKQECKPGGKGGSWDVMNNTKMKIILCPPGGIVSRDISYKGCFVSSEYSCGWNFWGGCLTDLYFSADVLSNERGKFIAYVQETSGNAAKYNNDMGYQIECKDGDALTDGQFLYVTDTSHTAASCFCRAHNNQCIASGNWIDSVIDKNCDPSVDSRSDGNPNY